MGQSNTFMKSTKPESMDDKLDRLFTKMDNISTQMLTKEDLKKDLDAFKEEILFQVESISSETKARHYDMQNITLANNGVSVSGYVNTSLAAGRSPRRKINSFDTLN